MSLQDLIVDNKRISEDMLEKILKDKVELIKENQGVSLTKLGNNFDYKTKILLYLCGKHAWELLTSKEILTSLLELEKNLGIKGNSLRPTIKDLRDSYCVESIKGQYRILPKGVLELDKEIIKEIEISPHKSNKKVITTSNRSPGTSYFINKLQVEGFFNEARKLNDIVNELKKFGKIVPITSLPPYLKPLLEKSVMFRNQIKDGKKNIWVYKKSKF